MNILKEIIQNKHCKKNCSKKIIKVKIYKDGKIPDDKNNVISAVFITIFIKLTQIFRY
jgi:hypothetical protein